MGTRGSSAGERTDGEAINEVARNCGSLAIECSDVAGYVAGVSERISANLRMLDTLEEVTTRLLADQARVSDSTDEARVLAEQARGQARTRAAPRSRTRSDLLRPDRPRRPARRPHGRLCRGDEPGAERLVQHRDDRQQDQHARPQRDDRGGAGRGGRALVRGGRRRGEEARPRYARRRPARSPARSPR